MKKKLKVRRKEMTWRVKETIQAASSGCEAASYNTGQVRTKNMRSACTSRGAFLMHHKVSCNVFCRQLALSINISTSVNVGAIEPTRNILLTFLTAAQTHFIYYNISNATLSIYTYSLKRNLTVKCYFYLRVCVIYS